MSSEVHVPCALEEEPLSDPLILRMLGTILQSETHVQRQGVSHTEMIGRIRDRYVKVFVDHTLSEHSVSSWLLDVFGYHYCLKCAHKLKLQLKWGCLTGRVECRISTGTHACAVSLSPSWCEFFSKDTDVSRVDNDDDVFNDSLMGQPIFPSRQPSVESIDLSTLEVHTSVRSETAIHASRTPKLAGTA